MANILDLVNHSKAGDAQLNVHRSKGEGCADKLVTPLETWLGYEDSTGMLN